LEKNAPNQNALCALTQLLEQPPCSVIALTDHDDHDEPAGLGHMNRACESTVALEDGGLAVAA